MRMILAILLTATATAFAQAPVETGRISGEQLQRDQFKAGNAYNEMQRAEQATRDAEQAAKRADLINKDAQKRAVEAQQQADAAKKKFEAAKLRETEARKAYDDALNAVDRVVTPPKSK